MTIHEVLGKRLYVTAREAMEILGVGKSTLYNRLKSGEIPNVGLGAAKRIPAWYLIKKLGEAGQGGKTCRT